MLRTTALLLALAPACAYQLGSDEESTGTTSDDLRATRVPRHFDFIAYECPGGTETCPTDLERCMCQVELDHMNALRVMPSGEVLGRYLVVGSDRLRPQVEAMGNRLAVNINELNAEWRTGASARADAMMEWARGRFPSGVPQWFFLNEISRAMWNNTTDLGVSYRRYVVDVVRILHERHGRTVVVFSPFYRPGWDGRHLYTAAWSAIVRYGFVGVENYPSGVAIRDSGFSEDWCRRRYQASIDAYRRLGVPPARLMLTEHYGQTVPGTAWGRSAVSIDDWLRAIRVRTRAARSLPFAGYVGYSWTRNRDGRTSSGRVAAEDAYLMVGATRIVRPPPGGPAIGGADADTSAEHEPPEDGAGSDPGAPVEGEPLPDPGGPPAEPPAADGDEPPGEEPPPDEEPPVMEPPAACDPPHTVDVGGVCVPSCGAAGGDTCATFADGRCGGFHPLESYDCEVCCARGAAPPPPPMCVPRTCGAGYGDYCGGAADGCGGVLGCGDTCGEALNCSARDGICRRALGQYCAGPGQCASGNCSWTSMPGSAARCCALAGAWCDSDNKCCGSLSCRSGRCG